MKKHTKVFIIIFTTSYFGGTHPKSIRDVLGDKLNGEPTLRSRWKTSINLKNNEIDNSDGLAEIAKKYANLKDLNLQGNKLTSISADIGKLKNLKFLTLSHNQLTSIPNEIGQLKKLKELALNNNELSQLPKEIGNLTNLEWLTLENNNLTSLPKEIKNLTKLTELSISNNKLSNEEHARALELLPQIGHPVAR